MLDLGSRVFLNSACVTWVGNEKPPKLALQLLKTQRAWRRWSVDLSRTSIGKRVDPTTADLWFETGMEAGPDRVRQHFVRRATQGPGCKPGHATGANSDTAGRRMTAGLRGSYPGEHHQLFDAPAGLSSVGQRIPVGRLSRPSPRQALSQNCTEVPPAF